MDANGMFRMSAERHEIIITRWHITRKTIKSLKKNSEKRQKTSMRRVKSVQSEAK